jgi:hypothetical protein
MAAVVRRRAGRVRSGRVTASAGRGVCLALLLVIGACRPSTPAAPGTTPAPHAVRYRLTWADGDVTPVGGGAWDVTTNLGYRVRVVRGWVTSYSMELVECPRTAAVGALDAWLFAPASAWAGHNAGTPNPAAVKPMQVESLTDSVAHDAGTVLLAAQPYCQVHYLVARAGHDSPGLPDEMDMVDVSLHVEGTYRAPGAAADLPAASFTIHTASAYGQLFARVGDPATDLRADPGRGDLDVEIRRHRSRLFDGVDLARMPVKAAGLRMLQALVDGVDVHVSGTDAAR